MDIFRAEFKMVRKLGEGHDANVYLVVHIKSGNHLALKCLENQSHQLNLYVTNTPLSSDRMKLRFLAKSTTHTLGSSLEDLSITLACYLSTCRINPSSIYSKKDLYLCISLNGYSYNWLMHSHIYILLT